MWDLRIPGADGASLTDIDFHAKKGETVAFIGSTGSGKKYPGKSDTRDSLM